MIKNLPPGFPDDLVAPFGGDDCCGGEIWLAELDDVLLAAGGVKPLVSGCCARQFVPINLGAVKFVSRAEWDATADDEELPSVYYVKSAMLIPLP